MELHNVLSGKYAEPSPSKVAVFEIDATIEGERDTFTFVSVPTDWNGLSADVAAWLLAHPDFEIGDYQEPPPIDPLTLPINRIQFEFMIEKLGKQAAIEQAIEAMPAGDQKILARVLFRSGQEFFRQHALFTQLAPAVGLSSKQVDDAWTEATRLTW